MGATIVVPTTAQWDVLVALGLMTHNGVILVHPEMAEAIIAEMQHTTQVSLSVNDHLRGREIEEYDFGGDADMLVDVVITPDAYAIRSIKSEIHGAVTKE